jgi:hypothetical protein
MRSPDVSGETWEDIRRYSRTKGQAGSEVRKEMEGY